METAREGIGVICDEASVVWETSEEMIFAAAQDTGKYKCLEACAKVRYRCEQQDANRPGSRENIDWSRQCQEKYSQCMSQCG